MDTITLKTADGATYDIPVVHAFDLHGKPVDLAGDIEPQNCDHAGAAWSASLDLRCPHCGSRLFIPTRYLARLPEDQVETMHALWVRAGWPEYQRDAWHIVPAKWTVIPHPLFDALGGLAVRNDRLDSFYAELASSGRAQP